MADNAASALCYVLWFITGVIFLLLPPYNSNRTVRFHAFQSIFLNIAVVVIWIAFGIVFGIIAGFAGLYLGWILHVCLQLATFVLWLYMVITTYQGKTTVLPIIGPLAQQQA
jgi:uncharacterized membrane protein